MQKKSNFIVNEIPTSGTDINVYPGENRYYFGLNDLKTPLSKKRQYSIVFAIAFLFE